MFDTINFNLEGHNVPNVSFLEETVNFFNVKSTGFNANDPFAVGELDNYRIIAYPNRLIIKDGSFCKWFFGDNFQTLGRSETKQGIERLSDTLHLPIGKAKVTRLDIADNIILKHQPSLYFPYLGELSRYTRLVQPDSLYYTTDRKILTFYDKVAEQKKKGFDIPEIYENRNVLRYELRLKKRLHELLKTDTITGDYLYKEDIYIKALSEWKDMYNGIGKYKNKTINIEQMRSKKDLYNIAIIALIEKEGGETNVLTKIDEMYKTGITSKKQAFDLKKAIKEACSYDVLQCDDNALIEELNTKIKGAIRNYR